MKPRFLSWNVRGLNKRSKRQGLVTCSKIGRWILFAFNKLSFIVYRAMLCAAYGVAIMWTSVPWIPVGPQGASKLCGT
jgi:hypothetical protein